MLVTIEQQIAHQKEEIRYKEKYLQGSVKAGKISGAAADNILRNMREILRSLVQLKEQSEQKKLVLV